MLAASSLIFAASSALTFWKVISSPSTAIVSSSPFSLPVAELPSMVSVSSVLLFASQVPDISSPIISRTAVLSSLRSSTTLMPNASMAAMSSSVAPATFVIFQLPWKFAEASFCAPLQPVNARLKAITSASAVIDNSLFMISVLLSSNVLFVRRLPHTAIDTLRKSANPLPRWVFSWGKRKNT